MSHDGSGRDLCQGSLAGCLICGLGRLKPEQGRNDLACPAVHIVCGCDLAQVPHAAPPLVHWHAQSVMDGRFNLVLGERVHQNGLGEFRSRSKGPEGEAVDDRRTAEHWTFERPLSSRDPNWMLVRVDAAEA